MNMIVRMNHVKCFMSTETCKSLMYNTVIDHLLSIWTFLTSMQQYNWE